MTLPKKKTPESSRVVLHQLMLPEHGNALGNVHGGVIMKMVDEAGAIAAMRHAQRPCVTMVIDSMTFRQPVHLGNLLLCDARVTYVGRTSIETTVHVHAENPITGEVTHTNSAHLVYVALGDDGRSIEVPRLELETDEDRRAFADGELRQSERVARRDRERRAPIARPAIP
jgi:acyl-CoA hydrolase